MNAKININWLCDNNCHIPDLERTFQDKIVSWAVVMASSTSRYYANVQNTAKISTSRDWNTVQINARTLKSFKTENIINE